MTKSLRLLAVIGSLWAIPALAADNAVIVTPGTGVTIRSIDIGAGVQAPAHAIVDASGAQLGISGAPLYIRGASAAFASGAYSSGAFASGAAAAGSWAAGALVDIMNVSTPITPTTATATKALNLGMQYNSTQATFTNGQQGAVQGSARGALYVATGADAFTATLAAETTKVIGTVRIASGGVASGSYASGAFASGAYASGSIASGAMVDLGAQADSACATDNGTCTLIALQKRNNQLLTTYGGSALPAQTTNAVNIGAVMNAGSTYETIAAGQTGQILGGAGAIGDYLSHCVIYPVTTSPGVVTVFDDATGAGANVIAFAGGATSLSNLAPIAIPVGAVSVTGEWRVTTGTNVIVTCYGKFT